MRDLYIGKATTRHQSFKVRQSRPYHISHIHNGPTPLKPRGIDIFRAQEHGQIAPLAVEKVSIDTRGRLEPQLRRVRAGLGPEEKACCLTIGAEGAVGGVISDPADGLLPDV